MIFSYDYTPYVVAAADDGGLMEIYRPEVPLTVISPSGATTVRVLIDSGADYTILPTHIARKFSISTSPALGPQSVGFGGSVANSEYADVELRISDLHSSICWTSRVFFVDSQGMEEIAVAGHFTFLEFFTSIFDGGARQLTLEPNAHIPHIV